MLKSTAEIPVFRSDLEMLRRLLLPCENSIGIYDPFNRLGGQYCSRLISLKQPPSSGYYFDLSGTAPNGEDCTLFIGSAKSFSNRWHYINNPDGTLRWIFPAGHSEPSFLGLYNSSSLKARAFRTLTRIAWRFGKGETLVHGTLCIDETLIKKLGEQCDVLPGESLSIFTGTRGATRKAVVEINNGKEIRGFCKIPVTTAAAENIENETSMLNNLKKYDFTTLSIPTVSKKINGHARLSNVKPAIVIPADKITAIHLRAMKEVYAYSHDSIRIQESIAWQVITGHMEFLKNELTFINALPQDKTKKIIRSLRKLYNSIPVTEKIPVSISHGDFTPWNMYCDEQRLFVYDWEMARTGMPMLFDLYHFTFQSTILTRKKGFREVESANKQWLNHAVTKEVTEKYNVNADLHFKLYLLFTVSYYIRQYLGEKELLMQSSWMIDAWSDALEYCQLNTRSFTEK